VVEDTWDYRKQSGNSGKGEGRTFHNYSGEN